MLVLVAFAFIAGLVTILSPCILPILPIILSSSVVGGKRRPIGVVTGFIFSFTFFTLFLTTLVKAFGIPADTLRSLSVVIVLLFGISLLIPKIQTYFELLFSKLSKFAPKSSNESGFFGGLIVGISIGLVWTPCVGPILASVISLALTGSVSGSAALITFSYSLGTAIPMLLIVYGGRNLLNKVPWLLSNTGKIQKAFGLLMIVTAIGIYFNFDRKFQTYILDKFPSYGAGLTSFEDNEMVLEELDKLSSEKEENNQTLLDMINNRNQAPDLIQGGQWFNLPETSKEVSLENFQGKVVLIDFWTYTCINCIRTLPYLKTWHEKYTEKGLVIIGVHTPEFEFEKNPDNVEKAIKDFGLAYIVMQDNNYSTWRAYNNRYWPAKYLIDKDGNIRYTHFGEGKYDETEGKIQELLEEAGSQVKDMAISNPTYSVQTRTPETYLGKARMQGFASPERIDLDQTSNYSFPDRFRSNNFAYQGKWTISEEYSQPEKDAKLKFNFEAKEVFLVMRPKDEQNSGRLKIYIDDVLVDLNSSGEDVDDSEITVDSDRLYKLIKLPAGAEHTLTLEFLDSNLELFAFTFG
jgi:cytochrome c biogenesis protein CcdA/thiol-disulfide isomerase/thioredoxin